MSHSLMDLDPTTCTKRRRVSAFREVGLFEGDTAPETSTSSSARSAPKRSKRPLTVRFRSNASIIPVDEFASDWEDLDDSDCDSDSGGDIWDGPFYDRACSGAQSTKMYRIGLLIALLALTLPIVQTSTLLGAPGRTMLGAKGGIIRPRSATSAESNALQPRDNSRTDVCKRWSHQTAMVNGTLYIYGGRASTDPSQQSDTWNNNFLTLDLTKTWQISSPALSGLPQPSGPPPIANGYLWNTHTSLMVFGGEYSDAPATSPVPYSLWEYDIGGQKWNEHADPKTSAGDNAESDGQPVQSAAEGAGVNVVSLGRGFYFGGHLDGYTTEGWSQSTPRVYLKSLLEFTFPGFPSNGKTAGADGNWRNITEGGVQDQPSFPERADGILVYVPGFGSEGILLGLAGGTNATFTQMNIIDVYDIKNSQWYKQATSGAPPSIRVNPCAVVAAAPDGSSYNVYLYGGQNLVPYKEQIQYDDVWILSIPSFTWIQVNSSSQVPPARAGHTCNIWDGQMVVVGGYVGQDLSCDAPGIYVFNLTSLEWSNQFTALAEPPSGGGGNPFSQQSNQKSLNNNGTGGLEGSFGYQVPDAVVSVIGGSRRGGATVTAPVVAPSSGPLATGKPIIWTLGGNYSGSGGSSGRNRTVAIAVGVIAGVLAIAAAYFAFCAWIYRKQLKLYKNHSFMAQRASANESARAEKDALAAGGGIVGSAKTSTEHQNRTGSAGQGGVPGAAANEEGQWAPQHPRRSSTQSSTDDLLAGQEPTFWGVRGVLLNPRRSLRIVNRD